MTKSPLGLGLGLDWVVLAGRVEEASVSIVDSDGTCDNNRNDTRTTTARPITIVLLRQPICVRLAPMKNDVPTGRCVLIRDRCDGPGR